MKSLDRGSKPKTKKLVRAYRLRRLGQFPLNLVKVEIYGIVTGTDCRVLAERLRKEVGIEVKSFSEAELDLTNIADYSPEQQRMAYNVLEPYLLVRPIYG